MDVTNETIRQINESLKGGLVEWLGIQIKSFDGAKLVATMPVNENTKRPGGILHGGSNLAFAETLGGVGSLLVIDANIFDARGIAVSANHMGSAKDGILQAIAHLQHKGRSTHVWEVNIYREDGKLISSAKVTNMIIEK